MSLQITGILFLLIFTPGFSHRIYLHKQELNMLDSKPKSWLALGDSYTIGQSVDEKDRYPVQAAKMLTDSGMQFSRPKIIAATGWTTADLLAAIEQSKDTKPPFDIVTLLIGVNNQYQGRSQEEYKAQLALLIKLAIQFSGSNPSHVVVISIPDYALTPFASKGDTAYISGEINQFNKIAAETALAFDTRFVDITEESRKSANDHSLLARDGLHYSGKEYAIWAKNLVKVVTDIESKSP